MERRDPARWARLAVAAVCVALGLAGAATSATITSSVVPGAVLDQNNPSRDSACRFTGWVPDDPADWAAQTFTAGVTGKLTDVAVWLRVNDPRISVAITAVGSDGRPLVATPLATTAPVVAPTTSYVAVDASFATPARVEAGRQYAVVVSAASGGPAGPWTWKADLGSSTIDPAGARCADGAYAGGRFWVSNVLIGPDADFFFQTYVVPARRGRCRRWGRAPAWCRTRPG